MDKVLFTKDNIDNLQFQLANRTVNVFRNDIYTQVVGHTAEEKDGL